jgi:glycosyltransferase involved in cell wall biosynthesis
MKILILPSFYCSSERPVLGIFFKDQGQALQRAGIEVEVLFKEARSLRELSFRAIRQSHGQRKCGLEDEIFTIRQCGWNPGVASTPGGRLWSEQTVTLFRRYLAMRGRPDIIHAHNSLWAGYAAFLLHQRYGIPYVITEHSSAFLSRTIPAGSEKLIRAAGDNAMRRISVSKALASGYQPYVSGPIQIIPNVVDTLYFAPSVAPRTQTTFVFLAAGHLVEGKGFHFLLRAFAAKHRNSTDVVLRIAGAGPEHSRLERLTDDLGIRPQVEFLGGIDRETVRSEMQAANAFVLPSLIETFGVVLIEAMSTGIPVISTRCGGPEEIITADTGLLTDPGDVEELGNALVEVRERVWDADLIRHSVESRFSSGVIAAALIDVYRSAIKASTVRSEL